MWSKFSSENFLKSCFWNITSVSLSSAFEWGQTWLLLIKLGNLHFPWVFGGVTQCKTIQHLSCDFVKSSDVVWIWKYCYFRWCPWIQSNRFWFSHFYAQNFKILDLAKTYLQSSVSTYWKSNENSKMGKTSPNLPRSTPPGSNMPIIKTDG